MYDRQDVKTTSVSMGDEKMENVVKKNTYIYIYDIIQLFKKKESLLSATTLTCLEDITPSKIIQTQKDNVA